MPKTRLMHTSHDISSIPLHCHICPRKPDFSDISHLLTHIASKGHLSNHFKMKVKAESDSAAQQVLDEYDAWYAAWNLQDHLRERMTMKEKKTSGGRTNVNGGSTTTNGRHMARPSASAHVCFSSDRFADHRSAQVSTNRATPASVALMHSMRRGSAHLVDPQLERRIKTEPASRSGTPNVTFGYDTMDAFRNFMPQLQTQTWDSPFGETSSMNLKRESPGSSPSSSFEPIPGHHFRYLEPFDPASGSSNSTNPSAGDEQASGNTNGNNLVPKGIQWPGMMMWDSATADMKRKRNQKKSGNVIQRLQATSEDIEPDELVFDATGTLRKRRIITGEPGQSDDSPLEGESSPEPEVHTRKRMRRGDRPALVSKSVNTNRPSRFTTSTPNPLRPLHANSYRSSASMPNPLALPRSRGSYFDGSPDEDDSLTFGSHRPVRRTGLSIHRDNTGPDITFNQPGMSYLTSSFRPSSQGNSMLPPSSRFNSAPLRQARNSSWEYHNSLAPSRQSSSAYGSQYQHYESFGQFFNAGPQLSSNTTATYHEAHTQPLDMGSEALHTNNNFLFQPTEGPDHLADLFNFDQSTGHTLAISSEPIINPLLPVVDFGATSAPGSAANPLFLGGAAEADHEDDNETISVASK